MSLSGSAEKQRLARKRLSMRVATRTSPISKSTSHPLMTPPQEMRVKVEALDSPANKVWTLPPMSPRQEMRLKLLPRIAESRTKDWISPQEEAEMSRLLLSPKKEVAMQVTKSLDLAKERHEKATESRAAPVVSNSRSLFKKSTKTPVGELTLERKLSFRRKSRMDLSSERETGEKQEETRDVKEEESDDDTIDTGDSSNIQALFGRQGCKSGSPKEETSGSEEEEKTTPDKKSKSEGPSEEKKTTPVDIKNESGDLGEEKKTEKLACIHVMLPSRKDGRTSEGPKEEKKTIPVESKSDRFAKMRARIAKSKSPSTTRSKAMSVQHGNVNTSSLSTRDTKSKTEVVEWPKENDDTPSSVTKDTKSKRGGVQWPHVNVDKLKLDTKDTNSKSEVLKVQQENVETSSFPTKDARTKSLNGVGNVPQGNVLPSKKCVQQPVRNVPQEHVMKERSNNANRNEEQQIYEPRQMSALSQGEIKDLFVEMAFFARLGFVQPPSCLQCVYRESIEKGTPDLHCKRFVPWRKNANTPIHPYLLDDNIVLMHCQAARTLSQGQGVEQYQWDKIRRQLVRM